MWRFVSLASLIIAVGVMMWPARATRHAPSADTSARNSECHVIEVMHYGGNLICHERLGDNLLGSGNNMIGRWRTEAMSSKSRGIVKQRKREASP